MLVLKWSIPSQHAPDHFASAVNCLRFSADGRRLVSSGSDQALRVWDVETGASVAIIEGIVGRGVSHLASVPPNKLLVGGHTFIAMIDLETAKEEWRWIAHWGWIYGIEVSDDARWFMSTGLDCMLKYWDFSVEPRLVPFGASQIHGGVFESKKFKDIPQSLAWSRSTNVCAIAVRSKIHLWDVAEKTENRVLRGHRQEIWGLAFSADGRWLASVANDKTIRIWNVADGTEAASFKALSGFIPRLTSIPGTQLVATADDSGKAQLWDLDAKGPIGEPGQYENLVRDDGVRGLQAIAASPDGKYLAGGGYGGKIMLWGLAAS